MRDRYRGEGVIGEWEKEGEENKEQKGMLYYYMLYLIVPTGLKKWVEVGNSGVFRPEMLRPMGLPPDVSVIAWGLSLERYDIKA